MFGQAENYLLILSGWWSEYGMPPSNNWNVTLDIIDGSVAKHALLVSFFALLCLVFRSTLDDKQRFNGQEVADS